MLFGYTIRITPIASGDHSEYSVVMERLYLCLVEVIFQSFLETTSSGLA